MIRIPEKSKVLPALLSLILVALSALCHYEALRWLNDRLLRIEAIADRTKVLVALSGSMMSHLCQIAIFAAAFYVLRDRFGLGVFGGDFQDTYSSFLYFSAETYTSLGFGDIYPIGPLRLLAGIESLTGLLMIGWTTSFTYLEMRRYWD